jgi:conjugative relaxase-like TrwC/TraI family protein
MSEARSEPSQTGNLVIALFQHDTNRNQEPNAHFHAVVANVTQGPDGKWRALSNDKLWEHNTLLNAMTMARFRSGGRKARLRSWGIGKHGNFEAVGVPLNPCAMPSVPAAPRS